MFVSLDFWLENPARTCEYWERLNSTSIMDGPAPSPSDLDLLTGMTRTADGQAWRTRPWLEVGFLLVDDAGGILHASEPMRAWLGCPKDDLLGKSWIELFTNREPRWADSLRKALTEAAPIATVGLVRDGTTPQEWYHCETIRHAHGWVVRLGSRLPPLAALTEGTPETFLGSAGARRQMVVRWLHAEDQLANLTRSWPGVIFSQRADFSFQHVSPRIEEWTGVPVLTWLRDPQQFWQVVHEADVDEVRQRCQQAAVTLEGVSGSFRIRHARTGRIAYIWEHRRALASGSGLALGFEGGWLDVTRQTIAERRLSAAAWKETLATLTMGLGHDFSNILAGIHSLSESFLSQLSADHPFHEGMSLIRQNAMVASQLVHRIVNLHRSQAGERSYYNLNEVVTELADLLEKILPRRISLRTELAADSLPLYVDAVELRQVMVNLGLNAAEAMPQRGTLTFRTRRQETAAAPSNATGPLPGLPCICLEVQDTGRGIAPRHLSALFEPFFTTKPMNKGSGLGLYNARLFAEKHGGAISVASTEGGGTTFAVWLPQANFSEAERLPATAATPIRPRILLGGDPGPLLESTAELLRTHGCYVVCATGPDQAGSLLGDPDNQLRGVMVLATLQSTEWVNFALGLHTQQPEVKTVLQLIGSSQHELDPAWQRHTHLLVTSEMSEAEFVKQFKALFIPQPSL